MNERQLTQIRNYLLEKKLPIDILVEVQDHFISQISDLERDENLTFEEALEKVKKSWQGELQPYWKGDWDLNDRSELLRKISSSYLHSFLRKSFISASVIILSMIIFSHLFSFHIFKYIFVFGVGAVLILPLFNYFKNIKNFRLIKKYKDHILISFQEYTLLSISCLYFYFKFFTEGFYVAKMFSETFMLSDFRSLFFGIILSYVLLVISFLSYFSQRRFLLIVEKVKPFLKYLTPSS